MRNLKNKTYIALKILTRLTMYGFLCFLLMYACSVSKIDNQHFNHVKEMKEVLDNNNDTPYPNQNFVSLTKRILDLSDDNEDVIPLSTASGVLFKNDGNKLYGLTASHWCMPITSPDFELFSTVLGYSSLEEANNSIVSHADFYGHTYPIHIIDKDPENDVCLFSLESEFANQIEKIKIAKKEPNIGEEIFAASAPLGISSPRIRLHFSGYYGGCADNMTECFYTIPGISGSSGSGVLNKRGELVSILTISIIGFHDVTGGVRLQAIKNIIDKNI